MNQTRIIHSVPTIGRNHLGKPSKQIRIVEIFTSALMRGPPPNLYHIKYIWDNLNSRNTPKIPVLGQGNEEPNKEKEKYPWESSWEDKGKKYANIRRETGK